MFKGTHLGQKADEAIDQIFGFDEYRNMRAYLANKGITIIDDNLPRDVEFPYPTKAHQYTRFYSKLFIEKADSDAFRTQRDFAERAVKSLYQMARNARKAKKKPVEKYIWAYDMSVRHAGQRLADEVEKSRGQIKEMRRQRGELRRKVKEAIISIGGPGGLATLVGGALYNNDVEVGGVRLNALGTALLTLAVGVSSAIYYVHHKQLREEQDVWDGLSKKVERIYQRSVFETLDDFYIAFPGGLRGYRKTSLNGRLD